MNETARDSFDGYAPAPHFCELLDGPVAAGPFGHLVRQRLASMSLGELRARQRSVHADLARQAGPVALEADAQGKGAASPARLFDVLPRLIGAGDWALIESGARQRVRTLNLFLQDVYGPQQALRDNVVPAELVLDNAGYSPAMRDLRLPLDTYIHVSGIDLVRGRDGRLRVLEDNVRAPSGAAHALENRRLMQAWLADLMHGVPVVEIAEYGRRLCHALSEVAPSDCDAPQIVVLSPGALHPDYAQHALLAKVMNVPLVTGRDLFVEGDRAFRRTTAAPAPVDVIYRQVSDDPLDLDSLLDVPGMARAYGGGRVNLANALGVEVADDKAIYAYVPRLIRYYLAEEPIIDNVETWICHEPDDLAYTLDHLADLVVKPVVRAGDEAITLGPRASRAELESCRLRLVAEPGRYISQPMLDLSVAPTLTEDGIRPRHGDLRVFAVTGRSTWLMPGGLARIAAEAGSLVVDAGGYGGSRDSWVLSDGVPVANEPQDEREAARESGEERVRAPAASA